MAVWHLIKQENIRRSLNYRLVWFVRCSDTYEKFNHTPVKLKYNLRERWFGLSTTSIHIQTRKKKLFKQTRQFIVGDSVYPYSAYRKLMSCYNGNSHKLLTTRGGNKALVLMICSLRWLGNETWSPLWPYYYYYSVGKCSWYMLYRENWREIG